MTSNEPTAKIDGPLHGLKIIDLTSVLSGPYTTQILGDLGAEVVKIEGPAGDAMRSNGVLRTAGFGHIFLASNRNKKSVVIDLKQEQGKDHLRQLLQDADVLVHNMRLAAIDRLGFSYAAVRAINPRIIYCSITGYGSNGPSGGRPAFDDVIQAASGLVDINSGGGQPAYVKTVIADKVAGLMAANAILAALHCRSAHGIAQEVEVPMLEAMTAFNLLEHMGGLTYPERREPPGYKRVLEGGRRVIRTQDAALCIMPYGPLQWTSLLERLGLKDAFERLEIRSRAEVSRKIGELNDLLESAGPTMSSKQWQALCDELDIACGKINPLDRIMDDEHLTAVGMFQTCEHPVVGPIVQVRHPVLYSKTPATLRHPAPALGEHTDLYLGQRALAQGDHV
ncbi:CoA transferase [Variovorax guangxiensis]|uniref:CaiB/BaiF CoA transferase family protein n=1 Tax=Variovorax guangxiensis TaxID=1775474 RepID=UPI00286275B8|nr:CoA transferase [Variovorax guangxiensis]MDR6858785.1 formyl-CoA transferase [Variovorax guangxiensis]